MAVSKDDCCWPARLSFDGAGRTGSMEVHSDHIARISLVGPDSIQSIADAEAWFEALHEELGEADHRETTRTWAWSTDAMSVTLRWRVDTAIDVEELTITFAEPGWKPGLVRVQTVSVEEDSPGAIY